MDTNGILAELRRRSDRDGQAETARQLGISRSYLCHILAGRKHPGRSVTRALGYSQETIFRRLSALDRR